MHKIFSIASRLFRTLALGAGLVMGSAPATAAPITLAPAPDGLLKKNGIDVIGKVVKSFQVSDDKGKHILVLSALDGFSQTKPSQWTERTDLDASYYSRVGTRWVRAWRIRDFNDCPQSERETRFFDNEVTATDLDNDGRAEITVAYSMACAGSAGSAILKVIMRQGEQKFAMRGRTRHTAPNDGSTIGGDAKYDEALALPQNAAFQRHIRRIRDQVVGP